MITIESTDREIRVSIPRDEVDRVTVIPEPSGLALLGVGVLVLRRRKR